MEEDSEGPIIDLPAKQKELKEMILSDPDSAWELLQSDPAMVLALTNVKRSIEKIDSENSRKFLEDYDKQVKLIFSQEHPLERYGIALTCEFITEYWRRSTNSARMSSLNEAIMKKMAIVLEAVDHLPDGYDKTITSKIVEFSAQRVVDFVDYDTAKSRDHLDILQPTLDKFVAEIVDRGDLDEVLSLSYFASASTESMQIFRNYLAATLLDKLKTRFPDMTEDTKYKIAPYLMLFENIAKEDEEDPENEEHENKE